MEEAKFEEIQEDDKEYLFAKSDDYKHWVERTKKTIRHRVEMMNFFEKIINPNFIPTKLSDPQFNFILTRTNVIKWFKKSNDRIEEMRVYFRRKNAVRRW